MMGNETDPIRDQFADELDLKDHQANAPSDLTKVRTTSR